MTNASNLEPRTSSLYRGRFAPSPTGPLHFGSLIAATGSYLQARSSGGEWLLRIDDIDPPREMPGASENILRTLEAFGFEWDGPVTYQSQHHERYRAGLADLQKSGLVYPCGCTRKTISLRQRELGGLNIYPGTCRAGLAGKQVRMQRINTEGASILLHDLFQGEFQFDLEKDIGDFVLLRADGLFSYQLATGIDDAEQGISEVIRGSDLLDSTPCQLYIQQCLQLPSPRYGHLPVALNKMGQKLSKQNLAPALESKDAAKLLSQALTFLGQNPPEDLALETLENVWQWAVCHWNRKYVPGHKSINI